MGCVGIASRADAERPRSGRLTAAPQPQTSMPPHFITSYQKTLKRYTLMRMAVTHMESVTRPTSRPWAAANAQHRDVQPIMPMRQLVQVLMSKADPMRGYSSMPQ